MKPPVLVTGASGFLGCHLVRLLLEEGERVRVFLLPGGDHTSLEGLPVERCYGDVRDPGSVAPAVKGCLRLYHLAGLSSLRTNRRASYREINVQGTRTVLSLAREAGVGRAVVTSSCEVFRPGHDGAPATEADLASLSELRGAYERSKFLSDEAARRMAREGFPVVIAHPTVPVGPMDSSPTPPGRMIESFLRGRISGYVDSGLNLVDVRDVARGHFLAMERGGAGEGYILGGENLSMKEIFGILEDLSGIRAPRFRVPYPLAWLAAFVSETLASVTGREPLATLAGVRSIRRPFHFDSGKAVKELGYKPVPVRPALGEAVAWFQDRL